MDNFPFLLPFVLLALVVLMCWRRTPPCPDCGAALPAFYPPGQKTRRMWRHGGYRCAACGCETDTTGRKVTADTPPPAGRVWLWVGLAVAGTVGVALACFVLVESSAAPAPPADAPAAVQPAG